jgi:hypothetical protein
MCRLNGKVFYVEDYKAYSESKYIRNRIFITWATILFWQSSPICWGKEGKKGNNVLGTGIRDVTGAASKFVPRAHNLKKK